MHRQSAAVLDRSKVAPLRFDTVYVAVSTICRISLFYAQAWIEADRILARIFWVYLSPDFRAAIVDPFVAVIFACYRKPASTCYHHTEQIRVETIARSSLAQNWGGKHGSSNGVAIKPSVHDRY
jgi:hypothetical protein